MGVFQGFFADDHFFQSGFRQNFAAGFDDGFGVDVVESVNLFRTTALRVLANGSGFLAHADDRADVVQQSRIAVMNAGTVRQVASPAQLYESPNSRFVADFIGKINLIDAKSTRLGDHRVKVQVPQIGEIELAGDAQGEAALAVRPEKIFVSETKPTDPDLIAVRGKVGEVAYYGSFSNVFFDIGTSAPILADIGNVSRDIDEFTFKKGEEYWLYWRKGDTLVLAD